MTFIQQIVHELAVLISSLILSLSPASVFPPASPQSTITPTLVSTATPASSSSWSVTATVGARVMNLRTGPSGMYGVSSVFYRGDILTILGKTIGDEWIYIKAHDGRIGWMFPGDVFVHINRSLDAVPILDTPDSFVITGAVYHADGSPAEDINIITTTIVDRKSEQTESHSDKFGTFYAFIPKNIGGTYSVGVGGIPCIKKGERFDCRIADGAIRPNPVELTLPQMEPIVFHLQMK